MKIKLEDYKKISKNTKDVDVEIYLEDSILVQGMLNNPEWSEEMFLDLIKHKKNFYKYDLPLDIIIKHKEKIYWEEFEKTQKNLTMDFLLEMKEYISFDKIRMEVQSKLSLEFIEEYQSELDWNLMSMNPLIDIEMLLKFKDKLNWGYISSRDDLTEDMIIEYKDRLDLVTISYTKTISNKELSEELKEISQDISDENIERGNDIIEDTFQRIEKVREIFTMTDIINEEINNKI